MLSVEHVRVRRDGERLLLLELSARQRARALELAEQLLTTAQTHQGRTREELSEAFQLLEVRASERRLAEGLRKLCEDACEFEQVGSLDPSELRREVFASAASARQHATLEQPFDRQQILEASAESLGLSKAELEAAMYADLRGAHRMRTSPAMSAASLVADYESAQVQALLLRAVSVVVNVQCSSPDAYRALFHKLKFRQLLFKLERLSGGGYRIAIDGPFSLFEAVTKYGLELALTLPALQACDVLELTASVRWGRDRTPSRFEYRHVTTRPSASPETSLRGEVAVLLEEFASLDSAWSVLPAERVLELPGVGVCVPDLVFQSAANPRPVYFELLGYWSRDAVWRRLELVERGLAEQLIFAVSSKLRVSEAVLDSDHAALYVFRGKPSARALLRKLEELGSAG